MDVYRLFPSVTNSLGIKDTRETVKQKSSTITRKKSVLTVAQPRSRRNLSRDWLDAKSYFRIRVGQCVKYKFHELTVACLEVRREDNSFPWLMSTLWSPAIEFRLIIGPAVTRNGKEILDCTRSFTATRYYYSCDRPGCAMISSRLIFLVLFSSARWDNFALETAATCSCP